MMDLDPEETITEAWDIYQREENDDSTIEGFNDPFRADLQDILHLIRI